MKYIFLKKALLVASVMFLGFLAQGACAATIGEQLTFNVESNFDAASRSQVSAVLIKSSPSLYFYIDKSWWEAQTPAKKSEIYNNLDSLATEFDSKIYPTLTSVFGTEWKPGVDSDPHVTILFHAMKEGAAGYFRSADEYVKLQVPVSNEREMIYISIGQVDSTQLKVFVGHEFTHLINFNQKDRLRGVQEETWLNEARADYAATILGYDTNYEGSNLQRRVRDFLTSPSDSLTEWKDSKYDYAVVSLFMHYLVDHYSIGVLADSMKSKSIGIPSINEVLLRNGAKENFSQIFTNWTIATLINDCSQGSKYCYLNQNLKNLRINPTLNFLPLAGNSSLSVTNVTKNWSGNWQKIIGGSGDLTLEFSSVSGLSFSVPYVLIDKENRPTVAFLKLTKPESSGSGQIVRGQLEIDNFDSNYGSLIILPSLQTKLVDFDNSEPTYPYSFKVSISGAASEQDDALIQRLLAQIEALKKQIADVQAQQGGQVAACEFNINIYFGMRGAEVTCLQQFLKNQGTQIYPEGLVTGNFGSLTKSAVIRFQRANGILQTGFVGPLTRSKINELIHAI